MIELLKDAALIIQSELGDFQKLVQQRVAKAVLGEAEAASLIEKLEQALRRLAQEHAVVDVERGIKLRQVKVWPDFQVALAADGVHSEEGRYGAHLPAPAPQIRIVGQTKKAHARLRRNGLLVKRLVPANERCVDAETIVTHTLVPDEAAERPRDCRTAKKRDELAALLVRPQAQEIAS
jgi:hypothetical protein